MDPRKAREKPNSLKLVQAKRSRPFQNCSLCPLLSPVMNEENKVKDYVKLFGTGKFKPFCRRLWWNNGEVIIFWSPWADAGTRNVKESRDWRFKSLAGYSLSANDVGVSSLNTNLSFDEHRWSCHSQVLGLCSRRENAPPNHHGNAGRSYNIMGCPSVNRHLPGFPQKSFTGMRYVWNVGRLSQFSGLFTEGDLQVLINGRW